MTPERKRFFLYVIIYSMAGSAVMRTLITTCPPWLPPQYLHAELALYGLLLVVSTITLNQKSQEWIVHLSLSMQSILSVATMFSLKKESPAMMLFAIGVQALLWLPRSRSHAWLIGLTISMTSGLMYIYGPLKGLSVAPVYASAFLFMGLFTYLLEQQEEATASSQRLLQELRQAYQQLQQSAAQAEELATTKERNRIARELHDSVTQMLFSMNLLAQTTRVMADKEAPTLSTHLSQLQNLTQDALSEMRYLIFQLRPSGEAERGLIPAIRQHISHLKTRHPLHITLEAEGEPDLSSDQTHKLFRITQEALNNVLKHAKTDKAIVRLAVAEEALTLSIEDEGAGFERDTDQQTPQVSGHMGLASMQERADLLGASFHCHSSKGTGTQICVTLPLS